MELVEETFISNEPVPLYLHKRWIPLNPELSQGIEMLKDFCSAGCFIHC